MSDASLEWLDTFDLSDRRHVDTIYDRYRELRSVSPVAWSEHLGGYWLVSRWEDVRRVLKDATSFSNRHVVVPKTADDGLAIPETCDPPEHTVYRQLLAARLAPKAVAALEPLTRADIAARLQAVAARGECEFIAEIAVPLPYVPLVALLGLPKSDVGRFLEWEDESLRMMHVDPEAAAIARTVTVPKVVAYFTEQINARQATADRHDDLLDDLVHGTFGNERPLRFDEMLGIAFGLFRAGLHTVTAVLGNMMWFLAQHREHREELVKDPARIADAVEELLRYESIISPGREALSDLTIGGCPVRQGDMVVALTGSAGRDESKYDAPDLVDFSRRGRQHLAFGVGPHRCVGSHLARMSLRVALEEIHRVIPNYSLGPGEIRRHVGLQRGTSVLPLIIT